MTNTANVVGRIVQDARYQTTQNGSGMVTFTVALNDRRVDRETGELREFVSFIDCVAFGKRADALHPYLTQGKLVAISGSLRQSRWTTNSGQHRSRISLVADHIDLLSPKREKAGA